VMTAGLILKRALASLPFGEWHGEDYDVLAEGVVVGRIFTSPVAPKGAPWFWSLAYVHVANRRPTNGTAATREAAMAAFAKAWRQNVQGESNCTKNSGPASC
jgi:hypothetical protein